MTRREAARMLGAAIIAHAEARTKARDKPGDTEALRALARASAFEGRARRRFVDAATEGLARQICAIVPGTYTGDTDMTDTGDQG